MATASASLSNMTVASSDNSGTSQGLLMPKLQYRFRVNFASFGTDTASTGGIELTKQVTECSRPSVTFQEITLPVYNSTLYLAGKHAWAPMTLKVRDDAQGGVAKAVGQQLQKQLDFYEQASAATGGDYKFMTTIEILDGGNGNTAIAVLEKWELYGCFLVSANYNSLNYATSDVVTIDLSIRFDNAIQFPVGVGSALNRILTSDGVTGIGN